MQFWEEDKSGKEEFQVPDDVVDLVYRISCRMLPLDHAHALSGAVLELLPWLDEEPRAGIHLIHGAESGNGWYRPEDSSDGVLHLPRRARMSLRVPRERISDAESLVGARLDVGGHALEVGEFKSKPLSALPTLFARHVVSEETQSEADFLEYVAEEMRKLEITVRKLMCGRSHAIQTPDGEIFTRSLMVADLEPEAAVRLQQEGVGPHRTLGCGLFIPHKGIKAVQEPRAKQ
jgi:CRISPR-associated protein Cas6